MSGMVPDLEACGKTGTAQNRGHDHSVFMGFAPMNKPKIAIAVYELAPQTLNHPPTIKSR